MDIVKKIEDYSLEEIMSLRFAAYAKEIIQDRAIPDVRDGLKPVQRRILYAMYKAGNTAEKGYIKCAATVGDVLGKFHPHGDSSVYDAMVRMSQWWKQNHILVDIHGNNGSMDGDGPAAYRYTEARLAKISGELLKDLDKSTVSWAPNFDDRFLEPTVLPAKFPNLLVNGTSGISAGYATNIPPHNLGEIIDATIKRIDSPNCYLETILEIVKGPDFPTGGIAFGKEGIIDAFKTGRGRIIVQAKYEFVKEKGKEQIIITEIPFEVNKQACVAKIEGLRIDKKVEGISEVRDETDRTGIRIAIDLKANANKDVIMKYLLKNTDLQISYNYNCVAIVNRTPKTLGILEILDAYIAHKREVITKRTEFDLAYYTKNYNIATGLIKAISILDEVIALIRASKNKSDAKVNLVNKYKFTEEQAEAIVTLQLYRLTNTDIVVLEEECEKLKNLIEECNKILNNETELKNVMKSELREIKKNYAVPRKTEIRDEIVDIKVDAKEMIPDEKVIVVVTNEGYVKRVSQKSFKTSEEETTLKPGDFVTGRFLASTKDSLLLFTNLGNYLFVPIHIIPETKWKDLGKHISNTIMIKEQEKIIASLVLKDKNKNVTLFTKNGLTKQVPLKDFEVTRYSKPMTAIKLKENDELINADISKEEVLFVTSNGLCLRFNTNEIPIVGLKASGVKGINLKDDYCIYASPIKNEEYLNIYTNYKTIKRLKLSDIIPISRAKKGNMLFKKAKTKDYKILFAYLTETKDINLYKIDTDIYELKNSDIPIMDIASTGSQVKFNYDLFALKKELVDLTKTSFEAPKDVEEIKPPKKEEQLSFDSFIDEFKI
ncbi:MAG: DNA topoisomerase IV subunit A [Firmicutes bacterium]|nr:DNA topoisomerase IV subunit A [Bacillota bacterium]